MIEVQQGNFFSKSYKIICINEKENANVIVTVILRSYYNSKNEVNILGTG